MGVRGNSIAARGRKHGSRSVAARINPAGLDTYCTQKGEKTAEVNISQRSSAQRKRQLYSVVHTAEAEGS